MVDLNQDVGAIIKDLLSKKGGDDASTPEAGGSAGQGDLVAKIMPFKMAIIFLILIIGISVAYHQMYYVKMQAANKLKMDEIMRLKDLQTKSDQLDAKIISLRKQLNNSKEEYLKSLSHFGNSEDLGELYQSISILAAKYNLTVLNIKELTPPPKAEEPKPIKNTAPKDGEDAPPPPPQNTTEVIEVIVEVELKGSYAEYIRFKEDLAVAEILLRVNSEKIKVKKDEQGKVFSTLNLTTYAIDKKQFQSVIGKSEEANNEK